MGLRGPLPQDGNLRRLAGGRKQPPTVGMSAEMRARLERRGEKIERRAEALLDGVKTGTARTKNNGLQVHPQLAAALRLFDAADRIWQRLGRLGPERANGAALPKAPRSKWDGLL